MSLRKRLFPAKAYLVHWLNAVDEHSLHSPFLFRFYREAIKQDRPLSDCEAIEQRRDALLADSRIIHSPDPGAGSLLHHSTNRKVADIAKNSLSAPKLCRFLYRLASYTQPRSVLELGTSLGISSAYLSMAARNASLCTIEGNKEIAAIAAETFSEIGISPRLIVGDALEVLGPLAASTPSFDLVYVDANHTEEATMIFFKTILPRLHHRSIVVIGDIHWSAGMESAWTQLTAHPAVTLSIDLFHAGLIFLNPDLRQETEVLLL